MKNFLHKETPDLLETDIHIPTVPVYMFLQLLNHNPPHPNTYNKKEEIQGYKEEFLEILELCKKNGIKTSDGLRYDESLKYPTNITD